MSILTITLLTKDHPDSVRKITEAECAIVPECDYLILDSSNETNARAISEMCRESKWEYRHLEETMTSDEKWLYTIAHFEGDYLWIIGDGVIPDMQAIWPWLSIRLKATPECIHLVNEDARNCRQFYTKGQYPREFDTKDIVRAASDFFWTATFMGSTIIHRQLIDNMLKCKRPYLNTGFVIPCLLFEALEKERYELTVSMRHYYYPNPQKRLSIWMEKGETFEIWSDRFSHAVRLLPGCFDPVKEEIIRTTCIRNGYYRLRWMLQWRAMDILNGKTLSRYSNSLVYMSNLPYGVLKCLSIIPRWLCRICYYPFELRIKLKYSRTTKRKGW